MVGYLFGGNTGETAESLARKRAMIERMMTGDGTPKTAQEGWARVMSSLGGAIGGYRLDQQEKSLTDAAKERFNQVMQGGASPPYNGNGNAASSTLGIGAQASADPAQAGSNGDYFSAIRAAESGGNDAAKNPSSSATGRYQFIDSTWNGLAKKYPELGLTPDGRTDPQQQERAIRAFTRDNAEALASAGIDATPGNLYAAHFLGAGGARSVLTGDDNSPVSAYVSPGVISANPFLRNMTVADFRNWSSKKGGGGSAPVEVASTDPRAAMSYAPTPQPASAAQAIQAQAPGSGYIDPSVSVQPRQPMPPLEAPREVASLNVAAQPAQQGNPNSPFIPKDMRAQPQTQVAQAQTQGRPQVNPILYELIGNRFLPEEMRAAARAKLEEQMRAAQMYDEDQRWFARQNYTRQQEEKDPLRQFQLEKAKLEIEQAKNGPGDTKVVGNRLLRVGRDGSVTDITPRDTPSGSSFRFSGNSVEAQALNGLMESGQLTEGQAQQLAAGKQVTGPNGEILFLTPQGIFSRPGGSQAQPQQQEIDIFGGAPASLTPTQAPATTPAPQQGSAPSLQQGAIQLTGPKPKETQLHAEMGARIGLGDAFLEMVPNLRERLQRGDASGVFDGAQLLFGWGEPTSIWRDIETGRDALVRNLTGAGMSESEAANQAARYQISPTDSAKSMVQKLNNLERDLLATRRGAIGARTGNLGPEPNAQAGGSSSSALDAARQALSAGADRDAVIKRLRENGIDPEGL